MILSRLLFTMHTQTVEDIGQPHHFLAAEHEVSKITGIYNKMLIGAGVAYNGLPLLVMLVQHTQGTLGPMAQWPQPYNGVYAFNQQRTPGYQFAYLMGITYNFYGALYYAVNDMLYLALCRYSVAYLDCLVDRFEAMDTEFGTAVRGARQGRADRKLERKFMQAIRMHYHILELL